jgi:hypothetical protein
VGTSSHPRPAPLTRVAHTSRVGPYIGCAGSSPDVRLVGVAGLDGPPERGGSTLIVSVGDRLLALCPSLAEKALQQHQQQQHAQPREAAGASHVPVLSLLSVLLSCLVSPFLDGAALSKLCCICGGVQGRPNLTREAGELLLARLRSARLLGDLGTAMPVWCSPLAGGPPSRSREHHQ